MATFFVFGARDREADEIRGIIQHVLFFLVTTCVEENPYISAICLNIVEFIVLSSIVYRDTYKAPAVTKN